MGETVYPYQQIHNIHINIWEYAVAQLVEALRYKPEGRGFDGATFFIDIILPVALWPWG
jgi:hypothetical protein